MIVQNYYLNYMKMKQNIKIQKLMYILVINIKNE